MKYQIQIDYYTGDSFSNEDRTDRLEETWTDLDIAKDNLKRIRDHYEYYEGKTGLGHKDIPKPDCVAVCKHDMISIKLLLDNGKEWQFSPYWCGYFEGLYGAEIVPDNTNMKFRV